LKTIVKILFPLFDYLCENYRMIMTLEARIEAFLALGRFLKDSKNQSEIELWVDLAYHQNNWFTLKILAQLLRLSHYFLDETAIRPMDW
jgi:hypothetical protein